MKKLKVIVSGGGTGGHIFPAIAIAKSLERKVEDIELLFVGAKDRMEMQKVPDSGYKIEGLWISGFQRSFSRKNLLFPFKLISSLIKSRKIIRRFQPDLVIGTGGFASG
ncbi:MAG: UDP-N-acetylglucosamine--N-acetylmuramyl-(pentapeptide) pyrophosphoryl-undecaprenol N-acetylglucosamine transferase, partial [Flavobacteriales bacterium]|nr:UDP-N-acetylglucosamine--N-acetylmuramyl-(pentapeptide) pyrophosphoryl-undecaprenol N-acetylglucosamine transferase [Flavobacteriales bacterium]MDG2058750.1 glycosyltransferase [Flavobacteriales bacterium]